MSPPDYHGWTHAPKEQGGTDPVTFPGSTISIFRAARAATVTVSGASQVVVDWTDWENGDPSVFQPLNTSLAPAAPTDDVRRVELDYGANPGRYTICWGVHNGSSIAGSIEMAMHDGDNVWGRPQAFVHGRIDGGLSPGFLMATYALTYPMFDPFAGGGFTPQLSFTLAQNGGVSEDFTEATLEIHYESGVVFP